MFRQTELSQYVLHFAIEWCGQHEEISKWTTLQYCPVIFTFAANDYLRYLWFQAFLPLLKKAASTGSSTGLSCSRAAIVNFSTRMGSIDDNSSGGIYAYRSSKVFLSLILLCLRSA